MKFRALLELCRISNLPTVWSNAVVGYVAGMACLHLTLNEKLGIDGNIGVSDYAASLMQEPRYWLMLFFRLIIPFSLLYTGGMILNDYLDRVVDAKERPSRPIPSGRVKPTTALLLAVLCLIGGLLGVLHLETTYLYHGYTPWRATLFGAVLVLGIVMYNLTHQRSARSVILMGLCRSLIVITAACAWQPPVLRWWWFLFVAGPAATLLIYTVLISIVARREVEPDGPRKIGGPKTVMNMIAAMPLLDAAWLLIMGLWPASLFCVSCTVMTKLGHRKVAGS